MHEWYRRISGSPDDFSPLMDAITFFEHELDGAKEEVKIRGSLEAANKMLPGIMEHRFGQLQEVEAILKYLEIIMNKTKTSKFKKYLEHYNKTLSSRDADKYAEGDDEVVSLALLINEIALVRNQYLAVLKGLEQKSFSVSNLTKLKVAGMEDYSV